MTQEFNQLASESFTARLARANLASKTDFAYFVKKTDFNDKLKNVNKNEVTELSKKSKTIVNKRISKRFDK